MGGTTRIRMLAAATLAVTGMLLAASASRAAPFNEIGDAGDLPGTARAAVGVGPLTQILGTYSSEGDADLYRIRIVTPNLFTVNVTSPSEDPHVWLFQTSGIGIAANDDDPSGFLGVAPVLPAGNVLYSSLPVGEYLLGVSKSGIEALNAGGANIFDGVFFTDIREPIGPGGPGPLAGWVPDATPDASSYTVNLVGAAFVPEPSTALLAGFGLCILLAVTRRAPGRRSRGA